MVGVEAYSVDVGTTVVARGYRMEGEEASTLAADIKAIIGDVAGVEETREALADLAETQFAAEVLVAVLAAPVEFEEWRVGEALGEYVLTHDRQCEFPWPDSRSSRNPNSSGGGVDLIGFQIGDVARLVLAEVKTSHQQAWPPNCLTSRSHGLETQLSGLIDGDSRAKWAIKYLALNGMDRPWFGKFRAAMATYLTDQREVLIFGVLVHVAEARESDLRQRALNLAACHNGGPSVELIALYLEPGSLSQLAGADISIETDAA